MLFNISPAVYVLDLGNLKMCLVLKQECLMNKAVTQNQPHYYQREQCYHGFRRVSSMSVAKATVGK